VALVPLPHPTTPPPTYYVISRWPFSRGWWFVRSLSQARWRRGEAVSMLSSRESMMSYEQLQYIPKSKA
jgi:hypothetical protein